MESEELKIDVGGGNHKMFSGTVLLGADGDSDAFCTLCRVQFSFCHWGINDVRKHFSTVATINSLRTDILLIPLLITYTLSSLSSLLNSISDDPVPVMLHLILVSQFYLLRPCTSHQTFCCVPTCTCHWVRQSGDTFHILDYFGQLMLPFSTESTCMMRQCCGKSRSFELSVSTEQEVEVNSGHRAKPWVVGSIPA